MNKLQSENKLSLNQEVLALVLKQYKIVDFTFEVITKGIANTTARIEANGQVFVIWFYAQYRKTDQQILLELRFQDYLRKNGIPIPRIYQNVDGTELTIININKKQWQVILMEFIEGTDKTIDHTPELIKELAIMQAHMHLMGMKFPHQSQNIEKRWDTLSDYYAVCIDDISTYAESAQSFVKRARDFTCPLDRSLPFGYNHLDLDLDGNVIVKNNKVSGVIDFDDLSYSPVAVCLGYSLWNVLHDGNVEKMKSYLNIYEQIRPLEPLERAVLPKIILFRNYEIGALRLYKSNNSACLVRPFEIETEIAALLYI